MKKKLQSLLVLASVIAAILMPAIAVPSAAYADTSVTDQINSGVASANGGQAPTANLGTQIKTITSLLLFILGAIAVIMIIIGGIRYVTSNGDSSQTKAAKDTILYAVIGIVVAISAYAIVSFVVARFASK